jgi:hypothetical protein
MSGGGWIHRPLCCAMRFLHASKSTHMTDKQDQTLQSPPASSYDRAIARAVEWLGDRYLLAKPINAHTLPRRAAQSSPGKPRLIHRKGEPSPHRVRNSLGYRPRVPYRTCLSR